MGTEKIKRKGPVARRDLTPFYIFSFYIAVLLVWNLSFILPPILALSGNEGAANAFYQFHGYFCHQRLDRSFCFFSDGSFGDCIKSGMASGPVYALTGKSHSVIAIDTSNAKGFELATCARDTAIYLAMLIGALALPFFSRIENKDVPPVLYFILAIVPLGIDGTGQLIGLWTSTNVMRVVTGTIAGLAVPIYLLPMLNAFFGKD